jgi:hypothetical protein
MGGKNDMKLKNKNGCLYLKFQNEKGIMIQESVEIEIEGERVMESIET